MTRLFNDEDTNPQEWGGMKVGSVICTYNAGFFVLKSIKRRFCSEDYFNRYESKKEIGKRMEIGDEYSPLFDYAKINLKTGKVGPTNGQCDSFYCKPGIAEINRQMNELSLQVKILENIENENRN